MNIAIITAGGIGTRMGLSIPKQFFEVNGKPLIVYTLEQFQSSPDIDAICLVSLSGYEHFFNYYIKELKLTKIKWIVQGGETNQMSIYNGLKCLKNSPLVTDDDIILVHDGIRPLVNHNIISDCVKVCKERGNAITVVPSNEAMLLSEDSQTSCVSIDRSKVWKTQTPHAMRFCDMLMLLETTIKKGIKNSVAICTMLIDSGVKVNFCKGDNLNFKLTTKEDIDLFCGVLNSFKNKS